MLLENSAPVSASAVAGGVPRHYCVAASRRRRSPHGGDSADGGANDPESLRNRLETAARGALCGREHPRGSQASGTGEIGGHRLGGLDNAAG